MEKKWYIVLKVMMLWILAVATLMALGVVKQTEQRLTGLQNIFGAGSLWIGILGLIISVVLVLKNSRNSGECGDAGQAYVKVGMAMAVYLCLVLAIQLGYESVMTTFFGEDIVHASWYSWVQVILSAYVIAFPLLYFLCQKIEKTTIEQKKMTVGQFLCCIFMNSGILFVGIVLGAVISLANSLTTGGTETNDLAELTMGFGDLWRILMVGFCAPILEELIFRKFLIDRVHKYGEGMAILTSGLLFGLYQGNLSQFFFSVGLGAFFAFIYIRTGKIWYTIVFHMISNLSYKVVLLLLLKENNLKLLLTWFAVFGFCTLIGIILWIVKRKKLYLVETPDQMEGKRFRRVFGNFGMIYFLLLVLIGSLASSRIQEEKQDLEHRKAWIADIDGPLREGLTKAVGVNDFLTAGERNTRLDTLIQQIETGELNDDQITYQIRELISDIHIGHMSFSPSSEFVTEDYYSSYLLRGKWFSDGFYICGALEEYKECMGGKLIAINNISIDEVLLRYDRIYSNETESFLKYRFENGSVQGFRQSELEYLGIVPEGSKEAVFTIEKDGSIENVRVKAVDIDGSQKLSFASIISKVEDLPYGEEIYNREGHPPFYYEIDKEHRALYLQYNECVDATSKGEDSGYPYFAEFFDWLIQDMKDNEVDIDCFVLDLRNNLGGGETLWNNAVIKYKDYLQKYPIKILIGKATFSAAVDAVDTTLLYFDDVTLYGEETGLAVRNYTGIKKVVLENTGGVLVITGHKDSCHVIHNRAKSLYDGVMPDVEVIQTFEGYINGIDEVYLRAVSK